MAWKELKTAPYNEPMLIWSKRRGATWTSGSFQYYGSLREFFVSTGEPWMRATHWMLLPAPPSELGEKK